MWILRALLRASEKKKSRRYMITANGSLAPFFLLFWVWVSTRKNCYILHSKRWYLTTFFNLLLFCSVLYRSLKYSGQHICDSIQTNAIVWYNNGGRTANALFILVGAYYFIIYNNNKEQMRKWQTIKFCASSKSWFLHRFIFCN